MLGLQHGARWIFVHADGRRTEYIYDRPLGAGGIEPHALLNPETGREAMVYDRWLFEGPVGSAGIRGHWIRGGV